MLSSISQRTKFRKDLMNRFERYTTYSEFEANYGMKLSLASFFNTTVITLIISIKAGNWWGLGGLTTTVYYIFVNDAIIPVIVGFIDLGYWIRCLKRVWLRWRR